MTAKTISEAQLAAALEIADPLPLDERHTRKQVTKHHEARAAAIFAALPEQSALDVERLAKELCFSERASGRICRTHRWQAQEALEAIARLTEAER